MFSVLKFVILNISMFSNVMFNKWKKVASRHVDSSGLLVIQTEILELCCYVIKRPDFCNFFNIVGEANRNKKPSVPRFRIVLIFKHAGHIIIFRILIKKRNMILWKSDMLTISPILFYIFGYIFLMLLTEDSTFKNQSTVYATRKIVYKQIKTKKHIVVK